MSKRPLSIAIIGWLFIVVGVVTLGHHLVADHYAEANVQGAASNELIWSCAVQFLGLVGGVFLLRRANWARWLLAAWMAFHIVLSFLNSAREVIVHTLLFGVIGYFLFRRQAADYFHPTSATSAPGPQNKNAAGG